MKKYFLLGLALMTCFGISVFITSLQAAEIIHIEGKVQVLSAKEEMWKQAVKGMRVDIGDTIRTARRSTADISLDETKKNIIRINPKTTVVLESLTPGVIDNLELSRGKLTANLESLKSDFIFEIETPSAIAGVRGSSYDVNTERDEDEVRAYKDDVSIDAFDIDRNKIAETMLPEGYKTFIPRFESPTAFTQVTGRELERWEMNLEEMTSRAEGREPPPRAELIAERAAAAKKEEEAGKPKEEPKPVETVAETVAETQEAIVESVTEVKGEVKESAVEDTIDETREDGCGGH